MNQVLDSARNEMLQIAISEIHASSYNPRKHFDKDALQELAESIKEHGLIEPIVVRERAAGGYEIIAGERRWRASQMAGIGFMPAIVRTADDKDARVLALVENLVRRDIDAMEEANGFKALNDLGFKVQEIADKVGRAQSTISNSMRLLELPENVQDAVSAGLVSKSHARALVPYSGNPQLVDLLTKGIGHGLTSKTIETFDMHEMPYQIRSEIYQQVKQLGTHACSFSPEANCSGCVNRVKRYCLDPECFNAKNAEAKAELQAQKEAELADSNFVDLSKMDFNSYNRFDSDMGCDADCPHVKQYRQFDNTIRQVCLNTVCWAERDAERERRRQEARQAEIDAVMDRSMTVIDHDDAPDHLLTLLAVFRAVGGRGNLFAEYMQAAADRRGFQVDLESIDLKKRIERAYYNGGMVDLLNTLGQIPSEYLIPMVAEAMLRDDAENGRDREINNWLCGIEEEEEEETDDIETQAEADCDEADGCEADGAECAEAVESAADTGDQGGTQDCIDASDASDPDNDGGGNALTLEQVRAVNDIYCTSADDGMESIKACTDPAVLAEALKGESKSAAPRKKLINAIERKMRTLQKAAQS